MRDPKGDGRRWLDQAENDLAFVRHAIQGSFFHQACFAAQQCAEKAVKAVLFAGGARGVIGHSVVALLGRAKQLHPGLGIHTDAAAELDLLYIPTRYPDALVEGVPHRVFTQAQAARALGHAEGIVASVRVALAG